MAPTFEKTRTVSLNNLSKLAPELQHEVAKHATRQNYPILLGEHRGRNATYLPRALTKNEPEPTASLKLWAEEGFFEVNTFMVNVDLASPRDYGKLTRIWADLPSSKKGIKRLFVHFDNVNNAIKSFHGLTKPNKSNGYLEWLKVFLTFPETPEIIYFRTPYHAVFNKNTSDLQEIIDSFDYDDETATVFIDAMKGIQSLGRKLKEQGVTNHEDVKQAFIEWLIGAARTDHHQRGRRSLLYNILSTTDMDFPGTMDGL